MKHSLWLRVVTRAQAGHPGPIEIVDTHAGAGLYDLDGPMAQKSREAENGIGRLMVTDDAPAALEVLRRAVRAENPSGPLRFYPGSPVLSWGALRSQDRYQGWELRPDDQLALQDLMNRRGLRGSASIMLGDGYQALGYAGDRVARRIILIDPPFERGDEASQIALGVGRALRAADGVTVAIWSPLKDLETFDSLLRALEALGPKSLTVAEVRLRPLLNPMRLNGSAMIFVDGVNIAVEAMQVCEWIAGVCGETGARGQVRVLIDQK